MKFEKLTILAAILFFLVSSAVRVDAKAFKNILGYKKGELLVKYKKDAPEDMDNRLRKNFNVSKIRTYHRTGIHHLKLPGTFSVEDAVKLLLQNPNVAYAEPNYIYQINETPNDQHFRKLWGLNNYGQTVNNTSGSAHADIGAIEAWDIMKEAPDVVVAVIDTGVDYRHPDLQANLWVNSDEIADNGIDDDHNGKIDDIQGWNFVKDNSDLMDRNGHGSHVAGTIGAQGNNSVGITGVAWKISIMVVSGLDGDGYGYTSDLIDAIQYASDNGAKVINLSWGGNEYSQALKEAISNSDALFVCAAGNDSQDTDSHPFYPAAYDCPNIISVAATDKDDKLAAFSNHGQITVDLSAPGVDIFSTLPPKKLVWQDTFDDGNISNWTSEGTLNIWRLSSSRYISPSFSIEGIGQPDSDSWIQSPALNLSSHTSVTLEFDVVTVFNPGDRLILEISEDGSTWIEAGKMEESTGTWVTNTFDISEMDGSPAAYIRFKLILSSNPGAGCNIDNIRIKSASSDYNNFNEYGFKDGTSMAAAHVSGAAALIEAFQPESTPMEIKSVIEGNVDQIAGLSDKTRTGGRLDLRRIFNSFIKPPILSMDPEFQVNTYIQNRQTDADLAVLENQYAMAVWFSESQDGANGVYGQIFDPQGNKSSSEIRINPLTDCLGAPKIAGLSNNTFIVIYQTTPATIKGQLLDHLGNKIGAELELISFEEGITNLNPAVTGLKNGGFILAWVCLNEQMVAFKELNGHAYENSGQKIGSSFSIEQIGSLFQIGGMPKDPVPEICPLTNGGFAVTWNNDKYQFPNSDPYPFLQIGNGILVKMYSANLIPHEGSLLLNSSPAAYQTPSQISALSEGGCVVTWQEGERVRAQMVSDDGHKISGDITINMYSSEFHRSESVRALPNGRFLAVWTSSDNYHDGLFAQLYAGNGYRIGDSFQVNTFGSPHPVLSAASASDGNRMFMVWTSDGKDGDSHGIFAKTLHLIDADADADGIMDMIEAVSCSDMLNKDSDNDGIDDGDEDANKNGYRDMGETNPCSADSDSDGLSDGVEDANQNGIVDQGETDPNNSDTDSDEMSDGYEIVKGLDPLSNDAFLDKDKDGYSNLREKNAMTAPDNEYSIPEIWADFDGYFDYTSPADCDGKDLYIMMKAIAANIDTQSPSGDSTSGGDIIIINPSERSCDYNYDGKVDAVDLIFFCEDFGRGGPL